MSALTKAAQDVLSERQRQIEVEGWTPKHDDEHDDGTLALAAACYAIQAGDTSGWSEDHCEVLWPWDTELKPKGQRRDLVRAAALLLAEIERLDRGGGANG